MSSIEVLERDMADERENEERESGSCGRGSGFRLAIVCSLRC